MQDRWSSTTWFVALAIDIVLCIVLAVSACWNLPRRPQRGFPERALANEVECGRHHRLRMLDEIDRLERERASSSSADVVDEIEVDRIDEELHWLHLTYVRCDGVQANSADPEPSGDRVAVP